MSAINPNGPPVFIHDFDFGGETFFIHDFHLRGGLLFMTLIWGEGGREGDFYYSLL